MSVGSATNGNSNAGGVGSNFVNGSRSATDKANNFKVDSTVSDVQTRNISTKLNTESLANIYASRTGITTVSARAKIENNAFAKVEPTKIDDREFDGHLVGKDGKTYAPGTSLSGIDAVMPRTGVTNDRTIIHVNGISTDVATQSTSLQAIANQTGSRVIGVHNATAGGIRDVVQSLGDKLDIGTNPAVNSLADTIYDELKTGRQVDLMAHSQGAIITSRALTDVSNRLQLEDGMTRQQAETLLGNVNVETFGGASRHFPDGPQYVHYVNKNDLVPMAFGLRNFLNPFAHAGRGAVTHYFNERNNAHGFNETYLPVRVPFEQARAGKFN